MGAFAGARIVVDLLAASGGVGGVRACEKRSGVKAGDGGRQYVCTSVVQQDGGWRFACVPPGAYSVRGVRECALPVVRACSCACVPGQGRLEGRDARGSYRCRFHSLTRDTLKPVLSSSWS